VSSRFQDCKAKKTGKKKKQKKENKTGKKSSTREAHKNNNLSTLAERDFGVQLKRRVRREREKIVRELLCACEGFWREALSLLCLPSLSRGRSQENGTYLPQNPTYLPAYLPTYLPHEGLGQCFLVFLIN
jgi:hypothetical protein